MEKKKLFSPFKLAFCSKRMLEKREREKASINKTICMAKRCSDRQEGSRVVAQRTGWLLGSEEESAILSSLQEEPASGASWGSVMHSVNIK